MRYYNFPAEDPSKTSPSFLFQKQKALPQFWPLFPSPDKLLCSPSHRWFILVLSIADLILLSWRGLPWPHCLGCHLQLLSLSSLFPTWNCHFSVVSRGSKGKCCSVCSIYLAIIVILSGGTKLTAVLCVALKPTFYNVKSQTLLRLLNIHLEHDS